MRQVWHRLGVVALVVLLTVVTVVASGTTSAALVAPDPDMSPAVATSRVVAPTASTLSLPAGAASPPPTASPDRRWGWPLEPRPQVLARIRPA